MNTLDTSSPVAGAVLGGLAGDAHRGAIMLRGHLYVEPGQKPGDAEGRRRIYIDDTCREWIDVKRGDILYYQPADPGDPCCPLDTFWIRREAAITRSVTGYAYALAADITDAGGYHKPPWGMAGGYHKPPWGMVDDPGGYRKPSWP